MDIIAETDDELMERYLDGQELTADEVLAGVNKAIASGTLVPIVCICAKSGIGVTELMDAIADFALTPGELVRHAKAESGQDIEVNAAEDAYPFVAQVFKTILYRPIRFEDEFHSSSLGQIDQRFDGQRYGGATGRGIKIHQSVCSMFKAGKSEAVHDESPCRATSWSSPKSTNFKWATRWSTATVIAVKRCQCSI